MDYEEKKYFRDIKMALRKLSEIGVPVTPIIKAVMNAESKLAESEDDRIRKRIINILGNNTDAHEEGWVIYADEIAWLEKQKEQKPTPDWMPKFLDELRSKKSYFDWDEHRDIEGHILAIINWIAPTYFDRKGKEQKPAEWSEEEERNIDGILDVIRDYALETGQIDETSGEPKEPLASYIRFVRSLRPQPRWKPSEELMKEHGIIEVAVPEEEKVSFEGKDDNTVYADLQQAPAFQELKERGYKCSLKRQRVVYDTLGDE